MIWTAANGTVRLRITVDAGDVGEPVTITATPDGGETRIVRGWDSVPATATVVALDHEADLNRSTRYAVLINGVETEAQDITLTADLPLVSDPVGGESVPVIIQDWPEFDHDRIGTEVQVAGSSSVVIIDGLEMMPRSSITMIVSAAAEVMLAALLADSSVVQIRPTLPYLPTVWASARGRKVRRFSRRTDSALVVELPLTHVAMPNPDDPAVGNTLEDLHNAEPGTLQDIADRWTTLADIAFEDLTA